MNQETNTNEATPITSVPFTGTGTVTVNKQKLELALPTVGDVRAAMADSTHAETVHGFVIAALSGFIRNVAKADRTQPTSFEGILEARALAAAAKGGTGSPQALLDRNFMLASMKAYLSGLGIAADKVNKIAKLMGAVDTLAVCAPAMREKIQSVAEDFAATLNDEDALQCASQLEKIAAAGSNDEDDLLSDF